jgi:hypothetical protein
MAPSMQDQPLVTSLSAPKRKAILAGEERATTGMPSSPSCFSIHW